MTLANHSVNGILGQGFRDHKPVAYDSWYLFIWQNGCINRCICPLVAFPDEWSGLDDRAIRFDTTRNIMTALELSRLF